MIDILDDSYESDLTDEESEQLLILCGHGIGPPLSPAARAVLDAFWGNKGCIDSNDISKHVAAALRAAADQVVPEHREHYPATFDERHRKMSVFDVRHRILAIAAELEGQ